VVLPAPHQPKGGQALRPHHELTLLKGGTELFPALVLAIDAALHEVLLETYIFDFARSVLTVCEALERAAARGVKVCVVVDGVGTDAIPPLWQQRWAAAGVRWRIFNPARGWRLLLPRRWRRLHRKLCVVDGAVAFCGGINLLDDHFDPNYGELALPRLDFAVRIKGPLVADVQDTMTRLWWRLQLLRETRKADLEGAIHAARAAAAAGVDMVESRSDASEMSGLSDMPESQADDPARSPLAALVLRDNMRFRRRIEGTYRVAIALAQTEILIASAYFVPGVKLQRSLLRAARRGVRVTLLLQGRYEYFMQHHASRAVYSVLLDAGITIYEYAPSFLHAKVAVMDARGGALATVGSSNLDPLSLLLAREANVFVRDDVFAAELRSHLLRAIDEGHRVDPQAHMNRPLLARLLNWTAYGLMRIAIFVTGNRY
jgi:cardiolipin synthase A/B